MDRQKAHTQFWNMYERPPRAEFQDSILQHRDLLVPQDVRERKGSYFTPQIWVALAQQYLADVLGQSWQDEYFIWDCAAGTGNLLAGLVNKEKIWASTLDQADIDIIQDRIAKSANLIKDHVFRFDFLNDAFSGCPEDLQKILSDPAERKKLIFYINPPYAEAANTRTINATKSHNKPGVSRAGRYTYEKYRHILGKGINEVSVQFLMRIFTEIPGCHIACFSKLKLVQSANFAKFRAAFTAKLQRLFIVPAWTFDNVKGKFPIGFYIWDTSITEKSKDIFHADVYDTGGNFIQHKKIFCPEKSRTISEWLAQYRDSVSKPVSYMARGGPDFQSNKMIFITQAITERIKESILAYRITACNLLEYTIFNTVRHVIPFIWINDRDQFLYPADTWKKDIVFQTDCLAWTLFHNNISVMHGINHWIPFTEKEVDVQKKFTSHFMTDYMQGKLKDKAENPNLVQNSSIPSEPLQFSPEAKAVFDAGRTLWRYYHSMPDANPDAAFYDIKLYFQGRNASGRMNARSNDARYMELLADLRSRLKILAEKIIPKVYTHGFLKK